MALLSVSTNGFCIIVNRTKIQSSNEYDGTKLASGERSFRIFLRKETGG